MNNTNTYLLIGGPRDGARMERSDRDVFTILLMPVWPPLSMLYAEHAGPTSATQMHAATYLPQRLRAEKREIIFYRHETLSVDEALMRVFERYPQEPAENER